MPAGVKPAEPRIVAGWIPGAHLWGLFCPHCSFSDTVTYMVPSVPCAVPFHLLLPDAQPLYIVPEAPPGPWPPSTGPQPAPKPWISSCCSTGTRAGGAWTGVLFPALLSAQPCTFCTSPEGGGQCFISPQPRDPHLQIKGSEWGEVLKSCLQLITVCAPASRPQWAGRAPRHILRPDYNRAPRGHA